MNKVYKDRNWLTMSPQKVLRILDKVGVKYTIVKK